MNKQKQPEPPMSSSEQREEIIKAEANVVSAFTAAIRFHTIRSAIAAYNGVILEQANTHSAFAARDRAILEAERSMELLKDAKKIHETDQIHRDVDHLSAKERLKQMQHEAKLAEMERKAEMRGAKRAFTREQDQGDMTEEDREMVDALLSKLKPDRYRMILEKAIREQNLSPDDEARARKIMEEIINQSL